jgi:predicted transposase/invertase (TIGR01784 family)
MRYEGELLESAQKAVNLEKDAVFIVDTIKSKLEKGEIAQKSADLIIKSLEDITRNVMVKSNIEKEEVDRIMEAVQQRFQLEPLNWREEGRVAGRNEGKIEGKIEGKEEDARKMFVKGFSFEDIQDITGFNTEILEKIRLSISK